MTTWYTSARRIAAPILVAAAMAIAVSPVSAAEKKRETPSSWRLSDVRAEKDAISARYSADFGVLLLHARQTESGIESTISTVDGVELTALRYGGGERIIPSLDAIVTASAQETLQAFEKNGLTDPLVLADLVRTYDAMAQEVYDATASLGANPLRYALPYHTSVIRGARRVSEGAGETAPVCTASPEYLYGQAVFRCTEDILETRAERENGRPPAGPPPGGGGPPALPYPCGGISGSQLGCCGNYSGPCYFCHLACLLHDIQCIDCGAWYCGPGCVPGVGK